MTDHIATGARRFVVDCSALEYIGSAGLRSLLTPAKTLRACDGELVYAALRDVVREVSSAPPSPRGNRIAKSAPGSKAKPASDSAAIVTLLT
jgi:STAS domain